MKKTYTFIDLFAGAGGLSEGLLIKKGEIIRKVPEKELLAALKDELDHWQN